MTPERKRKLQAVLSRRQADLGIITDSVMKLRNMAAILRSCDAVGVAELDCCIDPQTFRHYRGTSGTASKWVDIRFRESLEVAIRARQAEGRQVIATALTHRSVDYRAIDYTRATSIVMGTELHGMDARGIELCDACVTIPMLGMVESLNVSVACAVILFEAQRQRQNAGMYAQRSLSNGHYRRLFFKWAYPKLAAWCDARNLEYPELDDDGELRAGSAPVVQRDKKMPDDSFETSGKDH